ncbi:MAG: C4-dicarboxylate TRAP transporter substrate-binding protein [Pseudomonas sp.]|nr:C4-dicarboxylate TRAP transporter substrate-binding protein [Pseudomonas sp.]
MIKNKIAKSILLAMAVTACVSHAVSATQLRAASGVPPVHPAHSPLYTAFKEQLPAQSEGRLSVSLLGTEIVSLGDMRTGIKSGLVNVGLFLPAYFPADLPDINLVGDMALLGNNAYVMGAAMTEYVVSCSDCQVELKNLGIAYTTSHSTNVYQILSTKPIRKLSDLQGMRLRVGGPQYSRWAESVGATPANTPVGETFEALSQGVIDGTIASISDIISFRLEDAIKYISPVGLGTYHSPISHAVDLKIWQSLSPEDRKAIAIMSTIASFKTMDSWMEMSAKAASIAEKKGIETIEPNQEFLDSVTSFIEKDLVFSAEQAGERYKIKDASAKLERFRQLVDKWSTIVEEADNDSTKIAEALQREVWDKVDFNTYGI